MAKLARYAPLFIVGAALLWSFDGFLRRSLYVLPPEVIVLLEHLLGAIVLLPFLASGWTELRKLGRRGWSAALLVALLSGLLGTLFYTAALGKVGYIQFSVVVLLQQLQPIWAILGAALILGERMPRAFFGWAVPAFLASYLVSFPDLRVNLGDGGQTVTAALLAVGAGAMWGISTSFSKVLLARLAFVVATALRFGLTTVFAFLAVLALGSAARLGSIEPSQWLTLVAITLSTGMVALLFYYYGLRRVHASSSSILELTWPLSAILTGYLAFGEVLSVTQWLGVLVLLGSIWQISRLEIRKPDMMPSHTRAS